MSCVGDGGWPNHYTICACFSQGDYVHSQGRVVALWPFNERKR
jgi:hypothetical protein